MKNLFFSVVLLFVTTSLFAQLGQVNKLKPIKKGETICWKHYDGKDKKGTVIESEMVSGWGRQLKVEVKEGNKTCILSVATDELTVNRCEGSPVGVGDVICWQHYDGKSKKGEIIEDTTTDGWGRTLKVRVTDESKTCILNVFPDQTTVEKCE